MTRYAAVFAVVLFEFLSGSPRTSLPLIGPGPWGVTAAAAQTPANTMTLRNKSGAAIANYPLQFGRPFIDGAIAGEPQVLINGAAATSQADVKNRYPDGSVAYAVIAVVIPAIPAGGSVSLSFRNQATGSHTALTATQMLAAGYNFGAKTSLAGGVAGGSADARKMLQAGAYKLWTKGPVAQTIILADDSTAAKYDLGMGDGHHPFRPRFYATFWPATNQVRVRYVGEGGNPQQLEDISYNLSLTIGNTTPTKVYGKTGVVHYAMSSWTKVFWLGSTPSPMVDIDYNLGYLEATRFLPNYDTTIAIPPSTVATEYALWTGKPHDLYDGDWDGGLWVAYMGEPGARPDIGPYPTWTVLWLYTGDWRLRQMALGMADLAAAWPYHLRESDPARRLQRSDPAPAAGAAGTALGLPVSIIARPSLLTWTGDISYGGTSPADAVKFVGPYNLAGNPWYFEGSHEPAPFYPQYLLTGDPWYLGETAFWASWDAARYIPDDPNAVDGRGPDGSYGAINDEVRGAGWVLRDRVEAAFAQPDGTPEKGYLTALVNDALARWEGGFQITGTPYDGSVMKNWGARVGSYYTGGAPSILHYWLTNGDPNDVVDDSDLQVDVAQGLIVPDLDASGNPIPGAPGSVQDPWMQWYLQYCLGRATELGFAAGPVTQWSGQYLTGMINNSGYPILITAYEVAAAKVGGAFYTSWADFETSVPAAYLTGGGLANYFAGNLWSQGRPVYAAAGLAPLVDEDAPGAAAAWGWVAANVIPQVAASTVGSTWAQDPTWAIVPRADANTLPPQPSAAQ